MRISGGGAGDLEDLLAFPGKRPGLTADLVATPPPTETQSSASDVLTVAMGTGGAVTVAVTAIRDWIASMNTRVQIEVADRSLSLETRDADKVLPQVEQLLKAVLTGPPAPIDPPAPTHPAAPRAPDLLADIAQRTDPAGTDSEGGNATGGSATGDA
ncbi:MAG TPA: hypothetical protein VFU73_08715 [Actinocrinis sp.]|nr:hypothetical protein [Actinocrinis sp.]